MLALVMAAVLGPWMAPCGALPIPDEPGYGDVVVVELLIEQGWHGHADDGMEALYNPTCH